MKIQEKLERKSLTFFSYLSQFQCSSKCKMALNVVHQSMTYCRNFSKNEEICDINRFACQ